MARRNKNSLADDMVALVAKLPWWLGIALAIVLYLVLHNLSVQSVGPSAQPGQIGELVTHAIWKSLASVGQYLLPLICLVGSGVSAWRAQQRKRLVSEVTQNPAANALEGMSWQQFEMLVGEAYRLQGYAVTETGGGGADGGVDLSLRKGTETFLVQCKQWKAYKVGVDVVRQHYGVMAAQGAAGGFVVTSGRFTNEAIRFAGGRNLHLVDGPALLGLIRQAQSARGLKPASSAPTVARSPTPASVPAVLTTPADTSPTPSCPLCGKTLVKRVATRGVNAGNSFWGCTGYPACRGTRPML